MSAVATTLIVVLCMAAAAFFSGIETGVIALNRVHLRHRVRKNIPGAATLQAFRDNPDRLLGTTLVGSNLAIVVVSVVSAGLASRWLGTGAEAASALFDTVVLLVFCEFLPKAWFYSRSWERTQPFASLLRVSELALSPLSRSVVWLSRFLVPGPSRAFAEPPPFVTREDLKVLTRESEQLGALSPLERSMMHRVIELPSRTAGEVMVPAERMTFVHMDDTLETFYEVARNTRVSRMPVFDRNKRQFAGVVNVFSVLSSRPRDFAQPITPFIRPPVFIHETMSAVDIFPLLRRAHQPMGLVINGSREVVGLLTTEDILEEIVGKL